MTGNRKHPVRREQSPQGRRAIQRVPYYIDPTSPRSVRMVPMIDDPQPCQTQQNEKRDRCLHQHAIRKELWPAVKSVFAIEKGGAFPRIMHNIRKTEKETFR